MPTNYKLAIKHLDSQTPFRVDGDPEVFENITFTSGQTYTKAELDSANNTRMSLPPMDEIMYVERDAVSSTTSRNWVEKVKLTCLVVEGDYLIEWSAEARASKDKTKASIQCDLDDGTVLNSLTVRLDGSGYAAYGGFKKVALTDGVHTVDIDFKCEQSKKTMYIQNARIKITQV